MIKRKFDYTRHCDLFTSRNSGILSYCDQKKLFKATVSIAGTGGIGGLLSERLTRIGIGEIHLSDPDCFEISNLNRQFSSNTSNLLIKKVKVIRNELKKINPLLRIIVDSKGISDQSSADAFVKSASVIVDEMNFGLFKEAIHLQRAARKQNKYYMFSSAIGFGCRIVIFAPRGMTLEEFNGLPVNTDLDARRNIILPIEKISPRLPKYILKKIQKLPIQSILNGKHPVPVISLGAGLASIITANEVINVLLKLREIPVAPKYIYVDMLEQKYFVADISQ
jgi:molybdopterin/thiamine biosynthesis adenylyltransferase